MEKRKYKHSILMSVSDHVLRGVDIHVLLWFSNQFWGREKEREREREIKSEWVHVLGLQLCHFHITSLKNGWQLLPKKISPRKQVFPFRADAISTHCIMVDFHYYILDESICHFRSVGSILSLLFYFSRKIPQAM